MKPGLYGVIARFGKVSWTRLESGKSYSHNNMVAVIRNYSNMVIHEHFGDLNSFELGKADVKYAMSQMLLDWTEP